MKVEYYIAEDGAKPVIEWLSRLKDKKAKARIELRVLSIELGNLGDTKSVGDGVHALRIHIGPGYRVYYGVRNKLAILLLCGGSKGSQKNDVARAKEYWKEFRLMEKSGNG
jgi:putative addiction module killer protein